MSFLTDPASLDAIADRIASHASAARARADLLARAVSNTGWQGLAADTFRLGADDTIGGLRGAAGRLDDAAGALRRHAGTVRRVLDAVHTLGTDASDLAGDLGSGLHDEFRHPGRLPGDALAVVGDLGSVVTDLGELVSI